MELTSVTNDFYPRSPCGERLSKRSPLMCIIRHFYPRSPCGERHIVNSNCNFTQKFLSTLSLRRATSDAFAAVSTLLISIHALLAESDHDGRVNLLRFQNFYPRSPCGERLGQSITLRLVTLFLSTLSLRRATYQHVSQDFRGRYFYPRSPCGERQDDLILDEQTEQISIHALLAESD